MRAGALGTGALGTAGLAACTPPGPVEIPTGPWPYDCGVASGLHSPSEVVLWTRFAPGATSATEVTWQLATDPDFATVVDRGTATAAPTSDGCVKVLVGGLSSHTTYWYRFAVGDLVSVTGRTRTTASAGDAVAGVRLAVASCQSWSGGFYPAWAAIARADLDAVVFLGDYIYESGGGGAGLFGVRDDPVGGVDDLAGYRAKYRLYRSDPDLRAAHAAHAFAPVWDDHEFVNDFDRVVLAHQSARAADAFRAWFEYQPVWRIDGDRIHRSLRWGDLVDLSLLDTRQYRDSAILDPEGDGIAFGLTSVPPLDGVHAEGRSILGAAQRDWLLDGLGAAQGDGVRWKLVGNQVMISPIRLLDLDEPWTAGQVPRHAGLYANVDDWSGYMWERDLVTSHLRDEDISSVAFMTGDIHSFWQSSVLADFDEPSSPAVAQEFVCGSLSSAALEVLGEGAYEIERIVRGLRPGFRFADLRNRGFGLVECTPDAMSVEYRVVNPRFPTPTSGPVDRRRARFDWTGGTDSPGVTVG